jgi:hypothetical protein
VNNTKVDPTFVKLAMFDNQQVVPRLETKQRPRRHAADRDVGIEPKLHFGRMTQPMNWSKGKLALDTMKV